MGGTAQTTPTTDHFEGRNGECGEIGDLEQQVLDSWRMWFGILDRTRVATQEKIYFLEMKKNGQNFDRQVMNIIY